MRQFWPIPIYAFGAFLFNQCALIDALLLSNHHQLCAWTLVSKSYLKINLNVFTHPHILLVIFIVNLISFTLLFTMQQVRKSQFSATLLQFFPWRVSDAKVFSPSHLFMNYKHALNEKCLYGDALKLWWWLLVIFSLTLWTCQRVLLICIIACVSYQKVFK